LSAAWQEVRANRGAAGVDGQTIDDVERQGVESFLATLATELREGRYRPRAVRRVLLPKPDGRQRPLGIPTVRDRVVQAAAKAVLEPIFEADFLDCSYGFRPRRSAQQALEQVRQGVNRGRGWVVEVDLEACFERLDQRLLLALMERRISDRRLLKLVRQWLQGGVLDGGVLHPTEQGVPQGGVISPLLANILLHELDRSWETQGRQLGQLVRYADDFVVLCPTQQAATAALERVREVLAGLGQTLHPTKTRVVDVRAGRAGFDFLGFHCRKVASWRWKGKRYLQRWPSQAALQAMRDRVKAITSDRRRLAEPIEALIADLNRALRGWGAYFRSGNASRHFSRLDSYVRERLCLWQSRKQRRGGRRWSTLPLRTLLALGLYRLGGTVTWTTAPPRATR
jgi:group II intron reverse transcriptase/maturase